MEKITGIRDEEGQFKEMLKKKFIHRGRESERRSAGFKARDVLEERERWSE